MGCCKSCTHKRQDPQNINVNYEKFIPKENKEINIKKNIKNIIPNDSNSMNDDENDKKLISVIFKINESLFYPKDWNNDCKNYGYPIACYNSDDFSTIKDKLFLDFPDLKEERIIFLSDGNTIDESATLKRNKIKDNGFILIIILAKFEIKVKFISCEPRIEYIISCYDSNLFSTIEQKFYNKFIDLKEKNVLFQLDGNNIDSSLSLEQNNIKDNTTISVLISNNKIIKIFFCSIDQNIKWSISCNDSDIFSTIEKKLYNNFPELKGEYYFTANGNILEKSKTLKQNSIKDETIILINEVSLEENIDESKKLIAVIFVSAEFKINYAMPCYISNAFSNIEQRLYNEYPKLKEKKITFKVNGHNVDKSGTLEKNKIKNGTNIFIIVEKDELISVMFISNDQRIMLSVACSIYDKFSYVKQKLYLEYPELKDREVYFLCNGGLLNESLTLMENNIKRAAHILIYYPD